MAYGILRGKNGRRHDWETRPDGKRRYVHLNMPREPFLAAIAALARGAERPSLVRMASESEGETSEPER